MEPDLPHQGCERVVIAFSARNRRYAEQIAAFEAGETEYGARKYINTRGTELFEKKRVLFNFSEAKNSIHKAVVVFEGNADATTAFAGGLKIAVATCGTAFTEEHMAMLLEHGIKQIAICFDPDTAGEKATVRVAAMLEKYENDPQLKIEIITMPKEKGDADEFIRSFGDLKAGVDEFRKVTRIGLAAFNTKRKVREGADGVALCKEQLEEILLESNHIDQLVKADQLAEATGIPREFVRSELRRRVRMLDLDSRLQWAREEVNRMEKLLILDRI